MTIKPWVMSLVIAVLAPAAGAAETSESAAAAAETAAGAAGSAEDRSRRFRREGVEAQERGRHGEATQWFKKSLRLEPNQSDTTLRLAVSLQYIGEQYLFQAEQRYREALRMQPESAEAYLKHARFLLSRGDLAGAAHHLAHLKDLDGERAALLEAAIGERLDEAEALR